LPKKLLPPSAVFDVPHPRSLARHVLPQLIEGTIAPLALFYLGLQLLGLWGALGAALAWSVAAVVRRLVTRQPVPGLLLVGLAGLAIRAAVSAATGSVVMYFLQPTLGTVLFGAAFLISVPLGRPLAQKLALDFLPIPETLLTHPLVRRFFARISLLWAVTLLANAGIGLWLLLSQSIATFMLARTAAGSFLTVAAIALSTLAFRGVLSKLGMRMAFRQQQPAG
jgi:Protein of unknown function (DUF3159)